MKCRRKARSLSAIPPNMPGMESPNAYLETYMKLEPDVLMACDEMEKHVNNRMYAPSQELTESMADMVHDNVCRKYPDMAEYARESDMNAPMSPILPTAYPVFGVQYRSRGPFRDLIAFLILAEFFRRRRRRYS